MKYALFILSALLVSMHSVAIPPGKPVEGFNKLLLLPNGQLLFISSYDGNFYSQRLYPNGNPDPTYLGQNTSFNKLSGNPRFMHSATNAGILLNNDKLLLAGSAGKVATIVRMELDGSLDTTFNHGCASIAAGNENELNDIMELPGGDIAGIGTYKISGSEHMFITRLSANGVVDPAFGNEGMNLQRVTQFPNRAVALAVMPDGKFLALAALKADGYNQLMLVSYNTDGTLNVSFNKTGYLFLGDRQNDLTPRQMMMLPGGNFLIAGEHSKAGGGRELFVMRLLQNGSMDASFGDAGMVTTALTDYDRLDDLLLQLDGKIVVCGAGSMKNEPMNCRYLLVRYSQDGVLENTFGYGPKGNEAYIIKPGYTAYASNIILKNNKILGISEIVSADGRGLEIFNEFLADANLGLVDRPEPGFLEPADCKLRYNIYPSPISTATSFRLALSVPQPVTVKLFDINGKEIQTIVNNETLEQGENKLIVSFPDYCTPGKYLLNVSTGRGFRLTVNLTKI